MSTNDTDIVAGVIAGEEAGLLALYQKMGKSRYFILRNLGPQDLDDRVISVYMCIVEQLRSRGMRNPAALRGYIRVITKRFICAEIAEIIAKRNEESCFDEAGAAGIIDPKINPEVGARLSEEQDLVNEALAQLCKRDREILTRFYINEETAEEIQLALNLNPTQFRLCKSRAKATFGDIGKQILRKRQLTAKHLAASNGHALNGHA